MLCHSTLALYYQTIFSLAQHYKYQISEIENIVPYERDIYMVMLIDYINKVNESKNRNTQ